MGAAPRDSLWQRMDDAARMAWITECRSRGLGSLEMGKEGGTSRKSIESWLRARNMKISSIPRGAAVVGVPWASLPEPQKRSALMKAMALGVRGYAALGRQLGTHESTVRGYAKRHGITVPHGDPLAGIRRARRTIPGTPEKAPPPPLRTKPELVGRIYPHRVHMLDSKLGQCKFPTWGNEERPKLSNMFYCGAPIDDTVERTSYCPDCRAVIRMPRFTQAEKEAYLAENLRKKRAQIRPSTAPKF